MDSHKLSGLFADRYRIDRPLGRGASATVYLAHDTKQDREIALKVLSNAVADALGAKRFLQEIHITSRLQHPHILPVHDSGQWNGLLYYVLPFVSGESLRARLDRDNQIPLEECVRLTCDVASALGYAHSKGVIHRDVKPENILLSDGHALVTDFGIARTIDTHTGERLTSSGLIVGTSQYMSPEQASGETDIDARSDIYSLGCVLYEMLAGIEPFVGPNVQAVIAQRFTHAPRPVTMFRPAVPEHLVQVLDRALAISPGDRFQTMKEFESELPGTAGSPSDRRRSGRPLRDFLRTTRGKISSAVAVVVLAGMVAAALGQKDNGFTFFRSHPVLDSLRFVVLPVIGPNGGRDSTADLAREALHNGVSKWTGITVVPRPDVEDILRKTGTPLYLSDAFTAAEMLGAGKLLWGNVQQAKGGKAQVQLALYDVSTREQLQQVSAPRDSLSNASWIATQLLRDPKWSGDTDLSDASTLSFPAFRAYGRGRVALAQWDIAGAANSFSAASRFDPEFVAARLWSAQLSYWEDWNRPDWSRDALIAVSRASLLTERDAHLARALSAMADKEYPGACSHYNAMIAQDSMDVIAWLGLGECQFRDEAVARSANSASGWQFRSSFRAAASAFKRAVQIEPRAHLVVDFSTMEKLLPVSAQTGRRGNDSKGNLAFAAYPGVIHDTLSFVPYPLSVFAAIPLGSVRGQDEALEQDARELETFANSWIAADSLNPNSYEALATVLETQGNIETRTAGRRSISYALEKAILLATDGKQKTRLSVRGIRLQLKRGEFEAANKLGDSLLKTGVDRDAEALIVVAGFLGRTKLFAHYAQIAKGWRASALRQFSIPSDLQSNAAEFFARAALNDCGSDLIQMQRQIEGNIESYISVDKRKAVRQGLLVRSLSALSPCTGGRSALDLDHPEGGLHRAQQAFGRGDLKLAGKLLDSLAKGRANSRPGDVTMDTHYQEAWLRANTGDSVGAANQLDRVLNALPGLTATGMKDAGAAAAFGRAIMLRSELAAKQHDPGTAMRWMNALEQLYRGADSGPARALTDLKRLVARARTH